MNQRKSRIVITVFLGGLVGFCAFFTLGLSPYLKAAAERSDAFHLLGKCVEIPAGDVLVIEQRGERREIRLIGIEAPRMDGDAELVEQATGLERDPQWVAQQGQVSRNTLAAWIYRRGLHVTYPWGEDALDEQGRHWAYAAVAGVDLSRKLLQGGQVFAKPTDEPHPNAEMYAEMEAQARDRQLGIWRDQTVSLF